MKEDDLQEAATPLLIVLILVLIAIGMVLVAL